METTLKEFVRTSLALVHWIGGGAGQGHAVRMGALVGRATLGSRRCAFGHVSSACGADSTRLRRRAPGTASRLEQRRWDATVHRSRRVARGGDGWPVHHREFGRRGHAGVEQREFGGRGS
jgi:hypothetical protein